MNETECLDVFTDLQSFFCAFIFSFLSAAETERSDRMSMYVLMITFNTGQTSFSIPTTYLIMWPGQFHIPWPGPLILPSSPSPSAHGLRTRDWERDRKERKLERETLEPALDGTPTSDQQVSRSVLYHLSLQGSSAGWVKS